jgi:hypothetical protein
MTKNSSSRASSTPEQWDNRTVSDYLSESTQPSTWRNFASPGFGLVLSAPSNYRDESDQEYFQVVDPATGAAFTAAVYAGPEMDLPTWAKTRLEGVHAGLPFLRQVAAPKTVTGGFGQGILAEYEGRFDSESEPSHYLVLCFLALTGLASVTATIPVTAWQTNEALYRQLMTERLSVYDVREASTEGADLGALEAAASTGDPQAQFVLASALAQRADAGDTGAAVASVEWYRRAAQQGHVDAQVALGVCYANGWGCEANPEQAAHWWATAAGQGSPDGHFYLAVAYSQGFGLDADDAEAARHCRIAAEMGHVQAQEQLIRFG